LVSSFCLEEPGVFGQRPTDEFQEQSHVTQLTYTL
jgi:hypothetical protein